MRQSALPRALWIGASSALIIWCAGLCHTAQAETYLVNLEGTGDFPNLETALEQVVNGDVIELADGTYHNTSMDIGYDFLGKAITVRSQSGHPEMCIVEYDSKDCTQSGFIFQSAEGPSSILEGISITAGFGDGPCSRNRGVCAGSAGVLVLDGSSPTLRNLILQLNPVGVLTCNSSPRVFECQFTTNGNGLLSIGGSTPFNVASSTFDLNHTGVVSEGSPGTITGSLITRNVHAFSGFAGGAGVVLRLGSTTEIDSCRVQANRSGVLMEQSNATFKNTVLSGNGQSGPAIRVEGGSATIKQCTIASNYTWDDYGSIVAAANSSVDISHSIIWGDCLERELFADFGAVISLNCSLADSNQISNGTIAWIGTNVFEDPLFTEPLDCFDAPAVGGNFCPSKFSPAWGVPGCGNLGALIDDCVISVAPSSWGQIKALYR